MTAKELEYLLQFLGLTQADAAQLLSVAPRTIRRWLSGEEIPGPVEQALQAWHRLHERGLAWRPDRVSINEDDQNQIARYREHAKEISPILAKVEARGGPRLPWVVDRERCCAVLGAMQVSFYLLPNGGFSLANYTRKDGYPDVARDRHFIEDAVFCFAQELKKQAEISVTLVYTDAPIWVGPDGRIAMVKVEEFPSTEAALKRACTLIQGPNFHNPYIRAGKVGEIILNTRDLGQECERRLKKQL